MIYLYAFLLSFTASLLADLIVVGGLALLKDYLEHLESELNDNALDF